MKQYLHPAREEINLERVLHALSDPVRLCVVRCLATNCVEWPCGSFDVGVVKSKSTMSHHMRVLREAGIVRMRVEGKQSLTSLRREELESRVPGVLDAILRAAAFQAECL
jgi:DNA-binding transcriptional ArsR family regulator